LVIDLYQAALGLPPTRGRAARGQVVQRLLHLMTTAGVPGERARAVATDLDRAMELRDGVGVGAPEVADLRPRMSAGLAVFRTATAERERPLLTVIEDVHQADTASLEVLRHTLALPATVPELIVMTARPDGVQPIVDAVIHIGDLVGAELRALIADRLDDQATPFNIATVLARGGGNPLFIEELAQAVREAGATGEEVPASARDVVSARVDRLSQKARATLRFAAVLGMSVRTRLSLDELLGRADVARLSGHPAEAVPLLARVLDEFPTDRRAALAAFTKGRVHADALAQPRLAAAAFARGLALGLPRSLAEDAHLRIVEAWLAAGEPTKATAAATNYALEFPDGKHQARIDRLLGSP
jgi:hypothetical protein